MRGDFAGGSFQFIRTKIIGRRIDEIAHQVGGVCKPHDAFVINMGRAYEAGEFSGLRLVAVKTIGLQAPGQFGKAGRLGFCAPERIGTRRQLPVQASQMEAIIAWIGAENDFRNGAFFIRDLQEISGVSCEILGIGPTLRGAGKPARIFGHVADRRNLHFNGLVAAGLQQNFSGIHHQSKHLVSLAVLASSNIWLIVY